MVPDQIDKQALINCALCNNTLTSANQPKLMECLHAACGGCIKAKIEEQGDSELTANGIKCPKCEVFCNETLIIENHFVVENEAENDPEIKCMSCEDNAPATSYCVECKDFICASCVEVKLIL